MSCCIVSYLDGEGFRHTVEVQAASLYEAAALAIRAFTVNGCPPRDDNTLEIEVRTSVTHSVKVAKVQNWVKAGAGSPKEALLKDRLRELLE